MEPLVTLIVVTTLTALAGVVWRRPSWRRLPGALRPGLAAMFLLTGAAHFVGMRDELIAMVPSGMPDPGLLVTVSGIAEIAGAIGLLLSRTAGPAAAGLTLLLLVVFPANVDLALSGQDLPWWDHLVPRTILQLIFLAATTTVMVDQFRTRSTPPASADERQPLTGATS